MDPKTEILRSSSPILQPSQATVQRDSQNTHGGHNQSSSLRKLDTCYYCQQQGHWAVNCPDKLGKKSDPSVSNGVNGADFPDKQCPCRGGICAVLTSQTETNPGRKFYRCPVKSGSGRCSFFQWCDMESSDQTQRCDVVEPAYPICSCGAGRCSLLTVVKEGKNVGRKFFACPVKRGQGACNFFQWQELPERDHEMSNNHLTFSASPSLPHNHTKTTNCEFDRMVSDELGEKGSPFSSNEGCQDKEATRLNSMIDDDRLPPIERPSLHEASPVGPVTRIGRCYRCGEEGHWMNECVRSAPLHCFKCQKTGHWMKDCPAQGSGRCSFFQWCDMESSDQTQRCDVVEPAYPICSCGAGRCSLLTVVKEGKNVGRKFFACPVKRGQGACNFFQWQELPERDHEMSNNHLNFSASPSHPHNHTKKTNCEFDRMVSSELGEKGSPFSSNKGCQDKEATRFNSMIDDDRLPPIERPSLNETSPVHPVTRIGRCYRCGEEGHWMNECVRSPPSHCFKCQKIGHWMKDCPA